MMATSSLNTSDPNMTGLNNPSPSEQIGDYNYNPSDEFLGTRETENTVRTYGDYEDIEMEDIDLSLASTRKMTIPLNNAAETAASANRSQLSNTSAQPDTMQSIVDEDGDHPAIPVMLESHCSSSSSTSDYYLQPTEPVRDSGGYEYNDAVSIARPEYVELGPRPPQIPTVYDRLRHSGISTD